MLLESGVWKGGSIHLKLNIVPRSIDYKYREGNIKRTLKRELKGPEIADVKAHRIYQEKIWVVFPCPKETTEWSAFIFKGFIIYYVKELI